MPKMFTFSICHAFDSISISIKFLWFHCFLSVNILPWATKLSCWLWDVSICTAICGGVFSQCIVHCALSFIYASATQHCWQGSFVVNQCGSEALQQQLQLPWRTERGALTTMWSTRLGLPHFTTSDTLVAGMVWSTRLGSQLPARGRRGSWEWPPRIPIIFKIKANRKLVKLMKIEAQIHTYQIQVWYQNI